MPKPRFVRPFTDEERTAIAAGLRAPDACTLRRCHIVLASAHGQTALTIALQLHCGDQTVRTAMPAFNTRGLAVLQAGSHVAHHRPHTAFAPAAQEQVRVIIQRSPRPFGKDTSLWTLEWLAEVCSTEGLTARRVSGETLRATLERMGIAWKRAKGWITSPASASPPKQSAVTA